MAENMSDTSGPMDASNLDTDDCVARKMREINKNVFLREIQLKVIEKNWLTLHDKYGIQDLIQSTFLLENRDVRIFLLDR